MPRPERNEGDTIRAKTGCGSLFIIDRTDCEYKELFLTLGKTGGCAAALLQALATVTSIGLRRQLTKADVVKAWKKIRCPNPMWDGPVQNLSCPDAVAKVLEETDDAAP